MKMYCPKCGKEVRLTRAIRSRARIKPYEYKCSCGKVIYISDEDVEKCQEHKLNIHSDKSLWKKE